MTDAADLSARKAALVVLEAALARRGGLDEALTSGQQLRLSPQDRAFARALVMATLRHLGPIDRAIDARLSKEPPAPVRNLLRLGAAQAFWLDTPDFAAVNTTVELAPKPLRPLTNGVLRNVLRAGKPDETPDDMAPPWLLARWRAAYGEAAAQAIAGVIPQEPATDVTPKDGEDDALREALEAQALPTGSWRTRRRGEVTAWPGFGQGRWWVQDAAAALPARMLRVEPGQSALDMCAAPGGKTFQLALAGAGVTALDRSEARLRRVARGLTRLALEAQMVVTDAAAWSDTRTFDAVLLDAPCSATGTFRRHPDVLWNAKPGDIAKLAGVQQRLLASAARRTAPGGRLVYSVCSLEREEGEDQARAFLAAHGDFAVEPIAAGEGGAPAEAVTAEGFIRLLPHHLMGGVDGFFIARFRRSSGSA